MTCLVGSVGVEGAILHKIDHGEERGPGHSLHGGACRGCSSSSSAPANAEVADTLRLVQLLQAFRGRGHLAANLDPLRRTRGPWFTDSGAPPHCR